METLFLSNPIIMPILTLFAVAISFFALRYQIRKDSEKKLEGKVGTKEFEEYKNTHQKEHTMEGAIINEKIDNQTNIIEEVKSISEHIKLIIEKERDNKIEEWKETRKDIKEAMRNEIKTHVQIHHNPKPFN